MANTKRKIINIDSPRTNSLGGNAFWMPEYLATLDADISFWQFVLDLDGKAYGGVEIPQVIGATPAAKIILLQAWNQTASSKVSRMSVAAIPHAVAQSRNRAMTAVTAQDVAVPTTAYNLVETTFTLPTTGDFPVVAGDWLDVSVFHEGAHANDTVAVNTLLIAAFLEIDLS